MSFGWFNARQAAEVGAALADQFAPPTPSRAITRGKKKPAQDERAAALPELLRRAERETRDLGLNFFKKATFANSFKWKLLENGVERELADEVTRRLVLHISRGQTDSVPGRDFGFGWLSSGWVWLGIAAILGSLFSWLYVLRTIPLSIAFAFAGAIHILVPLGSWFCLGETISAKRWLGILLVTAGVLVSAKPATAVEEKL